MNMTRRSLFKRLFGVVGGLCCFGGSANAESHTTGDCCEVYASIRMGEGSEVFLFKLIGNEFVPVGGDIFNPNGVKSFFGERT